LALSSAAASTRSGSDAQRPTEIARFVAARLDLGHGEPRPRALQIPLRGPNGLVAQAEVPRQLDELRLLARRCDHLAVEGPERQPLRERPLRERPVA
jgi:hypothetical protein